MAAAALWQSNDPRVWLGWLGHHAAAVKAKQETKGSKSQLVELQRFVDVELPAAAATRTPPHITQPELVKLVEWKLARDQWRPSLLRYAKEQDGEAVEAASARALAVMQHIQGGLPVTDTTRVAIEKAMKELTDLKGVGPATASALLTVMVPSGLACYMSPEAIQATGGQPDKYTQPAYMALLKAMHKKAEKLDAEAQTASLPEAVRRELCCARSLERCLQAVHQFQGVEPTTDTAPAAVQPQPAAAKATTAAAKPAAKPAPAAKSTPAAAKATPPAEKPAPKAAKAVPPAAKTASAAEKAAPATSKAAPAADTAQTTADADNKAATAAAKATATSAAVDEVDGDGAKAKKKLANKRGAAEEAAAETGCDAPPQASKARKKPKV